MSRKAVKVNSRGCQNDLIIVEVFFYLFFIFILLINKLRLNVFGIIKPTQHHVVARFVAGKITLVFKNGLNK